MSAQQNRQQNAHPERQPESDERVGNQLTRAAHALERLAMSSSAGPADDGGGNALGPTSSTRR
jgi:hypothetical protein